MQSRVLPFALLAALAFGFTATAPRAVAQSEFPKPSPYPKSWELKFEHGKPTRVVVQAPGTNAPRAYWYMTYSVTNDTDREQLFLPAFEMLTQDGRVIRNDINIPRRVFDEIKKREGTRYLETAAQIGGELRVGQDQSRDGVAIWPEPMAEMGHFSIFVSGLSGETATVPGPAQPGAAGPTTKPVILRKTLQLNYFIRGDDVHPGEDEVNENPEEWVMR
jgi:hypothetical protein